MNQREVWDELGESWRNVRAKPWSEIAGMTEKLHGRVLDLGCGSGRNFFASENVELYGLDFSRNMLSFAERESEKRNIPATLIQGKCDELPFKDESFDVVLFIATLHCMKEKEREKSLEEVKRILKKEGYALITVWNKKQPRFFFSKKEEYVPWKKKGEPYYRYYYLFTQRELKALLRKHGFRVIKISGSSDKSYGFSKNIIAVAKKL